MLLIAIVLFFTGLGKIGITTGVRADIMIICGETKQEYLNFPTV